MHVALVTRLYAPEAAAAAYRLAALAEGLAEAGHEVTVLTTRPPAGATVASEPHPRIRVRRWPVKRSRDGQVRGYVSYLTFDLPAFWRLLTLRGVDVVVSEPPPTTGAVVTVAAALKRIPHVHYAADCWSDAAAATGAPAAVVSVVRALEGFCARHAAGVVTVNDGIAARLRTLHPSARITVVGNGVDTRIFRPDGPLIDGAQPTAVYAGTTSEWQGAGVLIDAWSAVVTQYPDAELVFLGSGTEWQALQERARKRELGDRVRFLPTVPPTEAARWIRSASLSLVSLAPSLGYDYALPTKVLASLMTGTPVVFSGDGVSARFLESLPPGVSAGSQAVSASAEAVAQTVCALIADPPSAAQRAALADWAAANVSLRAVAERVVSVIESAAGPRRGPPE